MRKRDYYEVLGLPRSAAGAEVRRAFQRLARRYSPDVNLWDERAAGLFEEIAEAHRVLSDPEARALYDRLGHRAFQPGAAEEPLRPLRGEDLHCPIEIDLEEAVSGGSAVVEVTRQNPCEACHAAGGADGARPGPCPACAGQPIRIVGQDGIPVTVRCQTCRGTGWWLPAACVACGGRGTVVRPARIAVRIPPGVDVGSQVRVPGEGHAAPAPAARGDLVVITRVRPHPFFTRKGDNLYCEVPVTVPEAALGVRLQVPTPDGPAVVTLPAGTQSGQVFRLRGRGCPRLDRDGRGDLYVQTRVVIPRNADSTLETVLRTLERLWPENPRAALWARERGGRG